MRTRSKLIGLLFCLLMSNTAFAWLDSLGDAVGSIAEGAKEAVNKVSSGEKNGDKKADAKNAELPSWVNEPLLTDEQCDNIKADSVATFMEKYKQPYVAADSLDAAAKKARRNYTLSAAVANRALLCTAESLSLKETIKQLNLDREILLSGTSLSSSEMKKHRSYSKSANKEIQSTLDKKSKVQPEQQKTMLLSFGMLLTGAYLTYETSEKLQKYKDEIQDESKSAKQDFQSGNLLSGLKSLGNAIGGGSDLLPLYEASVSTGLSLGKTAVSFQKFFESNDIEIPKETSQQFTAVTGAAW